MQTIDNILEEAMTCGSFEVAVTRAHAYLRSTGVTYRRKVVLASLLVESLESLFGRQIGERMLVVDPGSFPPWLRGNDHTKSTMSTGMGGVGDRLGLFGVVSVLCSWIW